MNGGNIWGPLDTRYAYVKTHLKASGYIHILSLLTAVAHYSLGICQRFCLYKYFECYSNLTVFVILKWTLFVPAGQEKLITMARSCGTLVSQSSEVRYLTWTAIIANPPFNIVARLQQCSLQWYSTMLQTRSMPRSNTRTKDGFFPTWYNRIPRISQLLHLVAVNIIRINSWTKPYYKTFTNSPDSWQVNVGSKPLKWPVKHKRRMHLKAAFQNLVFAWAFWIMPYPSWEEHCWFLFDKSSFGPACIVCDCAMHCVWWCVEESNTFVW